MNRRVRAGMTLLEVVVALAIAGAALAAGSFVLGFLVDQHQRANAESLGKAVSVRQSLRDWLAAADLGTAGTQRIAGVQVAHAVGEPPISELEFVTSAPTPVAGGGDARTRVHIALVQGTLVAELVPWPSGNATSLPLADHVTRFDVRYRTSVFGPPTWLDTWVSSSVLPAVVELRIGTTSRDAALIARPMAILVGERR